MLPILKARNENHALELANATEYGLSSAVFTNDFERGMRFTRGIVAGMTHINPITLGDHANAPFGSEKNSGLEWFNGEWAMRKFIGRIGSRPSGALISTRSEMSG
ncbi:MAG: aldehyde dehydrogenase family protein [Hyphomicrobiaceae bacterium]